ncbi:ADP-ribosylglycohydrolase family protein [Rhizohabitans arisaemae]|uniref:ADP-ribosylglycohydrolase family protein n=1 Tax=Rhizohabitans arisaemae TaxID=2720610 RepID=UPI0024B1571D|nr:ADP-ribosylglycohydrolase family protein [Rhizohabitans arisaemae]
MLRTLQNRCAYRLPREEWEEVRGYPDDYFVDALSRTPGAEKVPTALLDFGVQPSGVNRPQEPLSALFMLKRQLAESGVRTPRFDFAAVSYLHRSGTDVQTLIAELFPRSELLSAAGIADAFLQIPVVQLGTALFEWMNRRLDNLAEQRKLRRRVPPEVVNEVLSLAPEPELMEALPRLFCEDLRAALTGRRTPHRIVLFFDTYEAVAGEGNRSRFGNVGGPRWIRSLLGNLPLADGAVAVVAGRAAPTWSRALVEPIPERYIKIDALGALPDRFARLYLEDAGVRDPALQQALLSYANAETGLVHPLLLGLSTDVVLTAAEHGRDLLAADFPAAPELRDKERALAARLLSQVDDEIEEAVAAVSAARSFDKHLFSHLGAELDFPATTAVFRRLSSFSFVTPVAGEQRFALHQLLRRAISHVAPELVLQAHEVLADYYGAVGEPNEFTRRVEHIYHRTRLDPADGVRLWLAEMDRVLSVSRFDLCRSLLSVLDDLDMPSPEVSRACDYQVVRAEIALGRWAEAEERLTALPPEEAHTHLLQGELAFVRGDFDGAKHHGDLALATGGSGTARLPFLLFSANMMLFLGRFEDGKRMCREGITIIGPAGDGNTAVLWHTRLASIEFFSGEIEAAKEQLTLAARRLRDIPEANRDRQAEAGLRQEEAVVAEAEGRAEDALRGQAEVLRIRREIGDVRGVAHGLNGLGLAALQMGDAAQAEEQFTQSAVLARDLGERLLYAKATRGRAEAATLAGRFDDADRLAAVALDGFERADIPYDIVHAWITQARVHRARGDERAWLTLADRARREIEREGFGSLYARCPEIRPPSAERMAAAMTAFAAGDALGVPWEGSPPDAIDAGRIAGIPATRWGWPRGATSDDTAQMLLVGELLAETGGRPTAEAFLARLAAQEDEIRGIGPTTRRALRHFHETGLPPEPAADDRATNGAAMRMLPVGWITPAADPDLRRRRVEALSIATHRVPGSIAAACVVAAMASWAIEGVGVTAVLAAAGAEADWVAERYGEPAAVRAALDGTWIPPADGITLDALETAAAVVHVLRTTADLDSALHRSVLLGGDTDTVAALVGGIRGAMAPGELAGLPWLSLVDFHQPTDLAERLHRLRVAWYSG